MPRTGVDLNHFGDVYGEGTRNVVLNEPSLIVGAEEEAATSDAKLVELCLGGLRVHCKQPRLRQRCHYLWCRVEAEYSKMGRGGGLAMEVDWAAVGDKWESGFTMEERV